MALCNNGVGYGQWVVSAFRRTCLSAFVGRNNKPGSGVSGGTLGALVAVGVGTLVAWCASGTGGLILS